MTDIAVFGYKYLCMKHMLLLLWFSLCCCYHVLYVRRLQKCVHNNISSTCCWCESHSKSGKVRTRSLYNTTQHHTKSLLTTQAYKHMSIHICASHVCWWNFISQLQLRRITIILDRIECVHWLKACCRLICNARVACLSAFRQARLQCVCVCVCPQF